MKKAIGLVESAWFFRRGKQCVRIVRIGHRDTGMSLVIDGPDGAHTTHHFDDSMACAIHQCELERQLVGRNFHLERASGTRATMQVPVLVIPGFAPSPSGPAAA
jgi:hypothetical protein